MDQGTALVAVFPHIPVEKMLGSRSAYNALWGDRLSRLYDTKPVRISDGSSHGRRKFEDQLRAGIWLD